MKLEVDFLIHCNSDPLASKLLSSLGVGPGGHTLLKGGDCDLRKGDGNTLD